MASRQLVKATPRKAATFRRQLEIAPRRASVSVAAVARLPTIIRSHTRTAASVAVEPASRQATAANGNTDSRNILMSCLSIDGLTATPSLVDAGVHVFGNSSPISR